MYSFIEALSKRIKFSKFLIQNLDKIKLQTLFSMAFYQYRAIMHDIDTLAPLNLTHIRTGCICCPRGGEDGLFCIALDGCYRLCRKMKAGDSKNFALPRLNHFHVPELEKNEFENLNNFIYNKYDYV